MDHSNLDLLVVAIQELSLARTSATVQSIVKKSARQLAGADGATFVLRDGDLCHYGDEDAIGPLWKGKCFPMTACISGWAMLHRQAVNVPDILVDDRIPQDAYLPTFVRSLSMVPIRAADPIGAIGAYWSTLRQEDPDETRLLCALADSTAVALENVRLLDRLQQAGQPVEPQPMVRICSWTKRIEHEGAWLCVEEYLQRRFGLATTHGISDEAYQEMRAKLDRPPPPAATP